MHWFSFCLLSNPHPCPPCIHSTILYIDVEYQFSGSDWSCLIKRHKLNSQKIKGNCLLTTSNSPSRSSLHRGTGQSNMRALEINSPPMQTFSYTNSKPTSIDPLLPHFPFCEIKICLSSDSFFLINKIILFFWKVKMH